MLNDRSVFARFGSPPQVSASPRDRVPFYKAGAGQSVGSKALFFSVSGGSCFVGAILVCLGFVSSRTVLNIETGKRDEAT